MRLRHILTPGLSNESQWARIWVRQIGEKEAAMMLRTERMLLRISYQSSHRGMAVNTQLSRLVNRTVCNRSLPVPSGR
jgi:hypothetical protein